MSNMSYCRWHNTSMDMADCVASTEELEEVGGDNSYETMSDYEKAGVRNAAKRAVEMLRHIPLHILKEAGVDLSDLPSQDDIDGAEAPAGLDMAA